MSPSYEPMPLSFSKEGPAEWAHPGSSRRQPLCGVGFAPFRRRECCGEPGAGVRPFAERGRPGDAQRLGGLVDRQPGEEAMACDFGRGGSSRGQPAPGPRRVRSTRSGSCPGRGRRRRGRSSAPPRRAWRPCRAWSTRMRCMATAAARKKPLRSAKAVSARRRYASWTSAVASSECPGDSPASRAAASRLSSS